MTVQCSPLGTYPGQEVHQGERHGEGTQEDVGYRQVGNEDVPRGQHHLVGQECQKDGGVTDDAKYYDQTIENNQSIVNQRRSSLQSNITRILLIFILSN